MAVTQRDLAIQMLAQLRVLDPSVSAEVGTPERKILDTVAQALSDAQVDLTQLSGALDIDAKVGANLDKFLALFGFGRQEATRATGYVEFGREDFAPSNLDIRIPVGTQITLDPTKNADAITAAPIYETTFEATLTANQLSVLVPVRAVLPGSAGNLEAGRYFQFAGAYVFGITKMYNSVPITGGSDQEDDDVLKVRFKNTVFRNLAGTQDQYMALAAATAFTTKANVVGPISRYREYIQVPTVDDSQAIDIDPPPPGGSGTPDPGSGVPGEWTSALSTIPYSKHTYDVVPNFISNGKPGTQAIFYRDEIDWRLNTTAATKNHGDAYREAHSQFPQAIDPTSIEANRDASFAFDAPGSARPNVTFLNVYTGSDDSVTAIRPRDLVLFEHSYMSTASRNNYERNISNAVDVYIDGANITLANTVIPAPGASTAQSFVATTTSKYYYNNYRRWGEPDTPPVQGNIFIPLFWQPVTGLPGEINVKTETLNGTFYLNEHYWLVEDITEHYGTVRARNGIEWDPDLASSLAGGVDRSGPVLTTFPAGTSIPINNYSYDKNVVDLQSAFQASKQVTTDVLAHRARIRYFKLDITVMYSPGFNNASVNEQIRAAVDRYFKTQYFGNVVQLSDLLTVIHNVSGVDNVRWSTDVLGSADVNRVYETNRTGTNRPSGAVPRVFSNDFYLRDDELAALAEAVDGAAVDPLPPVDSDQGRANAREFAVQPGLIIRSRAQNTWIVS